MDRRCAPSVGAERIVEELKETHCKLRVSVMPHEKEKKVDPAEISDAEVRAVLVKAMVAVEADAAFVFAFHKTGV
jgi:hypothetical protein